MAEDALDLIFHMLPLPFGGADEGGLDVETLPPIPPVDVERASRPLVPGLPPYQFVPLPPPETYQLVVPGATDYLAPAGPLSPDEEFVPLSAPPPAMADALADAGAGVRTAPALHEPGAAPTAQAAVGEGAVALGGIRFDPLFAYLIYLALGFGTLYLTSITRYAVLWTALAVGGGLLTLVDRDDLEPFSSAHILWGASIGLVFSLPLLILNWRGLADMSHVLFPFEDPVAFFFAMVFVAPLGETLFFRGVLQEQRGFTAAVAGAGLSSLLFYWPAASARPVYLVVAVVVTTVLAAVYSFFRRRLGLVAALCCQITINITLLFLPAVLF